MIYNKLGSFSANNRAAAISAQIKKLSGNYLFATDSLKLIDAETSVDIFFGESIIASIIEDDAIWNNTS